MKQARGAVEMRKIVSIKFLSDNNEVPEVDRGKGLASEESPTTIGRQRSDFKCRWRTCYLGEIHEDGGPGVLHGDVSIWWR